MPIIGLGLHFILAVFFAIHAVRTRRNSYWLFILFSFPVLGSVVYLFVEYLPDLRNTRSGRKVIAAAQSLIDPEREWREANREYEISPSAQNRARLANALLARGQAQEAIGHYEACLKGPLSDDADLGWGLARAQLQANHAHAAFMTAQGIAAKRPDFHREELQLLIAQCHAALQNNDQTRAAFEAAVAGSTGAQARARYVQWLVSINDIAGAQRVKADLDQASKHWPAHARDMNQEWLRMAAEAMQHSA
jgi:hypothetical protein